VSWSAGSGAEQYEIQRKIAGRAWTVAGQVNATTLNFTGTPSAPGGMVLNRVDQSRAARISRRTISQLHHQATTTLRTW